MHLGFDAELHDLEIILRNLAFQLCGDEPSVQSLLLNAGLKSGLMASALATEGQR